MKIYYEINEELAKQAKECTSFDCYVQDTATKEYREEVDNIYEMAENIKNSFMDISEKAMYLADKYARQFAMWTNKYNSNKASCPSVMVCGPANFPTRKKEKQNEREGKLWQEYDKINHIKYQIKNLAFCKPKILKQSAIKNVYDLTNDYFMVEQNKEDNRIRLFFEEKPDEETRNLLKRNAWKWSPKNNAWQRQLTLNAISNVMYVIKKLKKGEVK